VHDDSVGSPYRFHIVGRIPFSLLLTTVSAGSIGGGLSLPSHQPKSPPVFLGSTFPARLSPRQHAFPGFRIEALTVPPHHALNRPSVSCVLATKTPDLYRLLLGILFKQHLAHKCHAVARNQSRILHDRLKTILPS
jgi:hypothetical protein